jgi:hypothetical protein
MEGFRAKKAPCRAAKGRAEPDRSEKRKPQPLAIPVETSGTIAVGYIAGGASWRRRPEGFRKN